MSYKTIRRDKLMRDVDAGRYEAKCTHHYTDDYAGDAAGNFGKTDWMPARISRPRSEPRKMPAGHMRDVVVDHDYKEGFLNFMECDFEGSCGRAYTSDASGIITLRVHSNLGYSLREKQKADKNPPALDAQSAPAPAA